MEKLITLQGSIQNGKIATELSSEKLSDLVKAKRVVLIKNVFSEKEMSDLRDSVHHWGLITDVTITDNFRSNYHMQKAKVSNLQQVPHVFHDYNFNDFSTLRQELQEKLSFVFELLRGFYIELTGNSAPLGVLEGKPYFHPQLIQYPKGGGFFGRHNHNLLPQEIGFILAISKFSTDYKRGGTCFEIDGDVLSLEGKQDIGDLCLWPNDVDHWVTQCDIDEHFNWKKKDGRWVATFAYFNPF